MNLVLFRSIPNYRCYSTTNANYCIASQPENSPRELNLAQNLLPAVWREDSFFSFIYR